MRKRRSIEVFSISFLDLLSGALGAVIILYVAIPKNVPKSEPRPDISREMLKMDLMAHARKVEELTKELQEAKEKLALKPQEKATLSLPTPAPVASSGDEQNLDVGFKFQGKSIVFLIDTSYSMIQEERMTQVKAGLKMFITSLSSQYKVEIVQFPLGERAPFRSMWGTVRETTNFHKTDIFDFIYSLKPGGGTPTREALLFVLKNYEQITDIVLLSDGQPTYHNSNKKDDIYDILKVVREENHRKIQISAIGVGSSFSKDKTSDQYKFLSLLSSENRGFFVGF